MKKIAFFVVLSFMTICLFACGKKKEELAETTNTSVETMKEKTKPQKSMHDEGRASSVITDANSFDLGEEIMETNVVEMKVKDYGVIRMELDPTNAPITVANFKKLVSEKFYDGITFHRIMQGFMIQGGDPTGTGMGGSENTIKGEFLSNGVENKISHKRGVVSMARASFPDSASSQFFICDADDEFLDGNYAAFGYVIEGMEVVDKIAADAKPIDNNGTIPAENQPVIEYIKMAE